MTKFATYLHPHIGYTSKPIDSISFSGHAVPYFSKLRQGLEEALADYPPLPVKKVEYEMYLSVHTAEYLEKLQLMAADKPVAEPPRLSLECSGYEYCLPGYLYGLGGMVEAIDQMKRGVLDRAYCVSLGGHHAYQDWGHGYCLLNPMAAAARYAQAQGFEKVLIIDWDLHHGDGTQAIFAHDQSVYCISIHSVADLYMSLTAGMKCGTTTMAEEVGHCNIPLLHEFFDDSFFEEVNLSGKFYRAPESLAAFRTTLDQIPWLPDLIFIFAGFDSHKEDCGEGITDWTNEDFQTLTRYVLELAQKASCPVLSSQGGGYDLPITISAAVSHVEVLAS
jgi:acetoin utilization deacetylase AcuC-like enzyme